MKMTQGQVVKILGNAGIRTLKDIDRYSREHPQTDRQGREYYPSRYDILRDLLGENAAVEIMHELSIQETLTSKGDA